MAYYIGLISGTSVDCIDAALVNFEPTQTELLATHSHPIPQATRLQLLELNQRPHISLQQLGELDHELGTLFADAAEQLISTSKISPEHIEAIGSHGQTIFHAPNSQSPFTMQIGDANIIAERTGINTVADLRRRDMAAGGQGAPLVPAFHEAIFHSPQHDRVIVNIGGIANISHLPTNSSTGGLGFDTGPGNGLLDAWIARHRDAKVDINGDWGRSGTTQDSLLQLLMNDDYLRLPPPKSTGRDYFNLDWLEQKLTQHPAPIDAKDVQATLHQLTAISIAQAIDQHASSCDEVYVCGGGAHNTFLIECLQQHSASRRINTTDNLGVAPDWVEAAAFAWLAMRTTNHQPGNLPSATGASRPVILGAIYPA